MVSLVLIAHFSFYSPYLFVFFCSLEGLDREAAGRLRGKGGRVGVVGEEDFSPRGQRRKAPYQTAEPRRAAAGTVTKCDGGMG